MSIAVTRLIMILDYYNASIKIFLIDYLPIKSENITCVEALRIKSEWKCCQYYKALLEHDCYVNTS